ncbi:MAG TPA: 2'-5' RNA ligase family protein [Caldilinea sp.]|nr:2'-5' RNA ligase family protein [Caldilinea sp.]
MAEQVVDTEVLRKSVTADEVKAAKQTYLWFGSFLLPAPLIALPPDPPSWYTRSGDMVLASTVASEDKWANAVSIAATKCASLEYDIEGDVPLRRNRMHEVLTAVDGMQGWAPFIAKQMQDFLCTNNGQFIEIVRATKSIGSRTIGLLHLDSSRCYRTGDPEIPVIYMDRLGRLHEMRAHQVIAIADMPTARLTFNGVGFCAAQRVYRTIYRMAAIEQYIAEKVTGRRPLKVTLVNGITQKQLETMFASADQEASAKGLTSYMGAAVSAVPTDEDISTVEIELSGLPDNFDLEKERSNANLTYANTIGLDIQDLQPGAIGGSLGSSTQSQVLDNKAKGKGLSYWRKAFTEQLNLKVLPDSTVFMFIEKDYRDEKARAEAANARQDLRSKMIGDTMIDAQQALQMAVDDGDAPRSFISQDTTPAGKISSDEKPLDDEAGQGDAANAAAPAATGDQPDADTTASEATKEVHAWNAFVESQKEAHTGAMVALYPTPEGATMFGNWPFDLPEGGQRTPSSEAHVTLSYLGKSDDITPDMRELAIAFIRDLAQSASVITVRFNGIARFNGSAEDGDAIVVLLASPELNDIAERVRATLGSASAHQFLAHVTLAYIPKSADTPTLWPQFETLTLERLGIALGGEVLTFPLAEEQHDAGDVFAEAFKSYDTEKAFRTELVRIKPTLSQLPDQRKDYAAYYQRVTKELRGYLHTLSAKCKELCPVDEGVTRNSIRPQIVSPDTSFVQGVLYAGNKLRPSTAIRSNLYGRRGFGPKDPNGVLAFETKDGSTVFTTHVAATEGNNWFAQAWKETAPQRRAMARRIGRLGQEMVDQEDVDLINAPHIDGYDEHAGATVPNTEEWRRRGGQLS